ncbi:MAG TPA: hypothetical protein VGC06_06630 [Actinomycetes bacterium]
MELEIGPFDPALHVRSRDHYEAVRREIRLLELQPGSPAVRLEELAQRLAAQFPSSDVDEVAERAYRAGESKFVARVTIPDDLVTAAIQACDEIAALLDDLDRWAQDERANLLEAPDDVKRYRTAYLAQVQEQLEAAARTADPRTAAANRRKPGSP